VTARRTPGLLRQPTPVQYSMFDNDIKQSNLRRPATAVKVSVFSTVCLFISNVTGKGCSNSRETFMRGHGSQIMVSNYFLSQIGGQNSHMRPVIAANYCSVATSGE